MDIQGPLDLGVVEPSPEGNDEVVKQWRREPARSIY